MFSFIDGIAHRLGITRVEAILYPALMLLVPYGLAVAFGYIGFNPIGKCYAAGIAEDILISSLKDPDSYRHVESRVTLTDDYYVVRIAFRAKNGYGGYGFGEETIYVNKADYWLL